MNKDVLLISVQDNLSVMGLKFVHYYLLANGVHSRMLCLTRFDAKDGRALAELDRFVERVDPCFIGLSLMSTEFSLARDLSAHLKERFPERPLVWGGIHPTIDPESCFPWADYACVGEGEKAALDLARALGSGSDPRSVKNLVRKDGKALARNPLHPLQTDLDALPHFDHIARESFLQERSGRIVPIDKRVYRRNARYQGKKYEIITSRGCAFACAYCCNNFLIDLYAVSKRIRRRSVGDIIAELEEALDANPELELIHIQDDAFMSCSRDYLAEFCREYGRRIRRPFIVHAIPVSVNRRNIEALSKVGLTWLNMGLQSGSDHVCKDVYKRNSLRRHFLGAARLVHEHGVAGKYDVILDNPFETDEERIETVETLMETPKPYLLEFFSLTFYAGTQLHEKAMKECPELVEDYREKDYLSHKNTDINDLTVLAACFPAPLVARLVRLYKKAPGSRRFRTAVRSAQFLMRYVYKPAAYARIFKRAHGGSLVKSVRGAPMYFAEALTKNT